jgi:hypothetical protein
MPVNARQLRIGLESHLRNSDVATHATGTELFDTLRNDRFTALPAIQFHRNAANVGTEISADFQVAVSRSNGNGTKMSTAEGRRWQMLKL